MTVKQCPAPFTDLHPHPDLAGYWIAPDGTLLIDSDGDYVDPETMEKYPPAVQESVKASYASSRYLTEEELEQENEAWDELFETLGIAH